MNGNTSTTDMQISERLSHKPKLADQWKSIDWKRVEGEVNRLQIRIAKAVKEKKWNAVKRLQYLLTHSYCAKLLAVRKVTTNNGKSTYGVDKEVWNTATRKMKAVQNLTEKRYKAKPLRRVYIEKKDKQTKRPLGIPTMYDRAMQALYALALDPVAEGTADNRSFGFRKGRSCQDACEQIFNSMSSRHSARWVLEGDIKGCFDNINHEWLIGNVLMDKVVLKQFLKAGYVDKGELFPTQQGTPQGGIISPILANMALDGMEEMLSENFHVNGKGNADHDVRRRNKVNLVRYADDFIVTANTKEIAEKAKVKIQEFLTIRGLQLSEEKTHITHIDEGFDMLGWNFRKYKGKMIIKPSKKAIHTFLKAISETILRRGQVWEQGLLIRKLNQQIQGWANYHQSVCASQAFSRIDHLIHEMLWRWAKRRHPNKGRTWVVAKYWHHKGTRKWRFSIGNLELRKLTQTHIIRHKKVRMDANPYLDVDYFIERRFTQGMRKISRKFKQVWENQRGHCDYCKMPIDITEEKQIFLKVPKRNGGTEEISNMVYIHKYCKAFCLERRAQA